MSVIVLLDAGPLGMVTNPKSSPENELCRNWLATLVYKGTQVVIPEIADYEVRRELLRADKIQGLARLDALKAMLAYAPITTPVMVKAAEFWAAARKSGRQSAADAFAGQFLRKTSSHPFDYAESKWIFRPLIRNRIIGFFNLRETLFEITGRRHITDNGSVKNR